MAYTEKRTSTTSDGKSRVRYVGRFRVDGRLKSTRAFPTKREAAREAEAQERAGKSFEWVDPKLATITLGEWFGEWQSARTSRARRTTEAERERFDSLIAPTFGRTPLRQLDYADISRWSSNMTSKRSGELASQARRRDATRLLVQVLDNAVDARRLRHNPARTPSGKVPYLPRASKTKAHRYLSAEQLRRVSDASGSPQARALILLTGLTGLRWGEVSALRIEDVDLGRARLAVHRAYTRLDDGTLLLGDTKTHADREVPLGPALREALWPQLADKSKTDLLFSTDEGQPLRRESFGRNSFEPAVRAAGNAVSALQALLGFEAQLATGVYDDVTELAVREAQARAGLHVSGMCTPETWRELALADRQHRHDMSRTEKISRTRQLSTLSRTTLGPGSEDFARLTLHDLRHTAASLAVSSGATVKTVQTMLGHESAKLTLDTYAGLFESDLDSLGENMSRAFEASAAH